MKLKHFYKTDKDNRPVPGSNISRYKKPKGYKEILNLCCNPQDIPCNCSTRYWVQVDPLGKPIPGTLIKRSSKLKLELTEGLKLQEINWMSSCCILDIDTFIAFSIGPSGSIFDETGEGYTTTLTSNVSVGENYQLSAIDYVEYFVDGVSVGIVSGNGLTNPTHPLEYTFILPGNQDHEFNYYAVFHFEGKGATYTTENELFTLQYNSPLVWNIGFTDHRTSMKISETASAQIAGWAINPNPSGAAGITYSYEGIPDFADITEEIWAGAKAVQIRFNPLSGDAGVYPISIIATNGAHIITRNMTITIDDTPASTYHPLAFPYTPASEKPVFVKDVTFDQFRYNKAVGGTTVFSAGDMYPDIGDIFGLTVSGTRLSIEAFEYNDFLGEGLFTVAYGSIPGDSVTLADTLLLKLKIVPDE